MTRVVCTMDVLLEHIQKILSRASIYLYNIFRCPGTVVCVCLVCIGIGIYGRIHMYEHICYEHIQTNLPLRMYVYVYGKKIRNLPCMGT